MSATHFAFTIDTRRRLKNVPMPKRMSRGVKQLWRKWNKYRSKIVVNLRRAGDNTYQKVELQDFVWGDGSVETYLSKGWGDFVSHHNLQVGDRILFTLVNYVNLVYRVRIWRGHIEITGGEAGSDSDDEDPYFDFCFLQSYVYRPTINIPLKFAKSHFNRLGKQTKVSMYVETTKYEATMHIRRDGKKRMISCSLKKGVLKFLRKEDVQVNEKVRVELYGWNPHPILNIIFI